MALIFCCYSSDRTRVTSEYWLLCSEARLVGQTSEGLVQIESKCPTSIASGKSLSANAGVLWSCCLSAMVTGSGDIKDHRCARLCSWKKCHAVAGPAKMTTQCRH